jgi:hypothetical protein
MFWNGSLSKALTDAKGTQHLIFLATGPEIDRQGERMSTLALGKFEGAAKAGKVLLTPSHDVPLPLGKSVDSTRTDTGDSLIDFALDPEDPLARKAFRLIEAGEWHPQVSIGAEKVTREKMFDAALGKSITEISDVDVEGGLHCALTFPGRAVYRSAGLVQALTKAFKGDAADLAKRGWPEDAIAKATSPGGEYTPPTFAQRHTRDEFADELPGLLDTLRWCIEDIVSPWSGGNKPALLAASFREFAATVGLEIADAGGLAASGDADLKADGESADGLRKDTPPEPTPPDPPPDGGGALQKFITEGLSALEARLTTKVDALAEGLAKATQDAPVGTVTPEPVVEPVAKAAPAAPTVPDTTPAKVPHTGLVEDNQGVPKEQGAAKARQELQDKAAELRKAIDAAPRGMHRDNLTQQYNGLLGKLSRMP